MLTAEELQEIEDKATHGVGWWDTDAIELSSAQTLELVKMARRYLWLRDISPYDSDSTIYATESNQYDFYGAYPLGGEELDNAIDSAINSQRKEGGEG